MAARMGVRIAYSREPWPALETGGGILQALPLLGDEPVPARQRRCVHRHRFHARCAWQPAIWRSWCWCPIRRTTRRAISASIRRAHHRGRRRTAHLFRHCACCDPALFAGAEPGRFPLLPWLLRAREAGRLGGQQHAGLWLDIGTPERLAQLDAELRAHARMTAHVGAQGHPRRRRARRALRHRRRAAARNTPPPQGFTAIRDGQKPRGERSACARRRSRASRAG